MYIVDICRNLYLEHPNSHLCFLSHSHFGSCRLTQTKGVRPSEMGIGKPMGSPDLGHRSVDIENGSKHHDYTVIVRIYIYISYIYV